MKSSFALALAILASATSASASQAMHDEMKSKVVAATKHLSEKECQPHAENGLQVTSCEYLPAFIDGEWSVMVRRIFVDKNGKRVFVMGGDTAYQFTKNGKFIEAIGGM